MAGRHRDQGSTSAIGFAVAAGLFAISFTAANLMVEKPAARDLVTPQLDAAAATALDLIVSNAGRTTAGGAWADAPDALQRFGLASPDTESFLDYKKIKSMRNASMTSKSNAAPDYPDVRAALGINDRDFHLRTYPALPGYDDPRWTKEPHGRYAYVAHDLGTNNPPGVATVTSWANTSGKILNVSVAVRNDGPTPYLFSGIVSLGKISTGAQLVDEERHTRLLSPGEVQTLWVNFPEMSYTGNPDGVRIVVVDAAGNTVHGPVWKAATVPSTGSPFPVGVKLTAGARYYISGQDVNFHLDRFDPTGSIPNENVHWRFVLVSPAGVEMFNDTVEIKKKKSATYKCTTCTAEGVYTGFFYNSGSPFNPTLRARDVVQVLATAPVSGTPVYSGTAGNEIALLQKLVVGFNPTLYDEDTNPQGDIFDDSHKVRDLPPVLDRYSSLVVGSGVSQTSLNSGDIKWGIADWVIAGGNLVVLGREDGHANWLQPVYKASISSASGGIGAPDPTHPVLVSPNRLDYKRYNDAGLAWGIQSDQPFTHVLTKGTSGNEQDDALAVANPGAYRDGSVVLTSYMPGALTTPQDNDEAARFLHNLLSQSYNMLFLDYGPPVPSDTPVGAAQRLVAVPHPNVPGAVVEVKIVMYAWS